jgi:site-specific recombinase XerD
LWLPLNRSKDRVTFLGGKSKKAVWKYLQTRPGAAPDEPMFPSSKKNERLTVSELRQLLRRPGKRAGVANCHLYGVRVTAS